MSADTAMKTSARHDFSKFQPRIPVPDLLAIQLASWESFLQEDVLPEKREEFEDKYLLEFLQIEFVKNCK